MITELEQEFYKAFNIGKPVIKKWYYDGYYEDFSWQCLEEDCTELLKYFDNSINKLNDRIQQMKKEENTKYDRYTDSVTTEFGRVSGAYIIYPKITDCKLLQMICIYNSTYTNGYSNYSLLNERNVEKLKEQILKNCLIVRDDVKQQIQQLFKEEEGRVDSNV